MITTVIRGIRLISGKKIKDSSLFDIGSPFQEKRKIGYIYPLKLVMTAFWKSILIYGIVEVLSSYLEFAKMKLITEILESLEQRPGESIYHYIAKFIIYELVRTYCRGMSEIYSYMIFQRGCNLLQNELILKILYMKEIEKSRYDSGRILNLQVDIDYIACIPLTTISLVTSIYKIFKGTSIVMEFLKKCKYIGIVILILSLIVNQAYFRMHKANVINYTQARDSRMKVFNNFMLRLKQYKISNFISKAVFPLNNCIEKEMKLYKIWYQFGIVKMSLDYIFPLMINITSLYSFSVEGVKITASVIQKVMSSFSVISDILNEIPDIVVSIFESRFSYNRYIAFILLTEKSYVKPIQYDDYAIKCKLSKLNTTDINISSSNETNLLKNIDIEVKKGEHVAITGDTGSGKSLIGMLLTNNIESNSYSVSGAMAYIEQSPWIECCSIKEYVTQQTEFDSIRFNKALECTCMKEDVMALPLKENSMIGIRASNLSKGQIARIALASAIYSEKDIYVIDDIFSSMNATVMKEVFQRTINEFLANKTIVLITNNAELLKMFSRVILVKNFTVQNCEHKIATVNQEMLPKSIEDKANEKTESKEEKPSKENTHSSLRDIIKVLFSFNKSITVAIMVVAFAIMELYSDSKIYSNSDSPYFLLFYIGSSLTLLLSSSIRLYIAVESQFSFCTKLHNDMISSLCKCSYNKEISGQSMGNYITLFSTDFDYLCNIFIVYFCRNCAVIVKLILNVGYYSYQSIMHLSIPVIIAFIAYKYGAKYLYCNELNSELRNKAYQKINNFISNVYEGSRSIWSSNAIENTYLKSLKAQNSCLRQIYNMTAIKEAANFIVHIIFLIWEVLILCLAGKTSIIGVGITAFALRSVEKISSYINAIISTYPSLSAAALGHKRCSKVIQLPTDSYTITDFSFIPNFNIEFQHAAIGFDERIVLEDVNLEIPFNSSIAIVGRTGSGKTTLCLSLIRMNILSQGSIYIGGINIKELNPFKLREYIHYLAQDLILYEGTLYSNIDPLNLYTVDEVKARLKSGGLWEYLEKHDLKLDRKVGEECRDISEGEKQILFICRAYINRSKVIIFDEPFGSADEELQESMFNTIFSSFNECTKIIITHHLNESRKKYFDRVLTIKDGKAILEERTNKVKW